MPKNAQATETAQSSNAEVDNPENSDHDPGKAANDNATLPSDEPLAAIAAGSLIAEERSHGRVHDRVDLEISVTLNGEDTFYTGVTENISKGGVFVFTRCPWPLNTKVDLSLSMGDAAPFFLSTTIRWVRDDDGSGIPPGMGLQFENLKGSDEQKIRDFLKKNGKSTEFYDL